MPAQYFNGDLPTKHRPHNWNYADNYQHTTTSCPNCGYDAETASHVEQTGSQETCRCSNCGQCFLRTIRQ